MKRYLSLAVALTLAAATITDIALRSQNPVVDAGARFKARFFPSRKRFLPSPERRSPFASSEGTRAVWINFYEMGELCRDKNADTYRAAVGELLDECAALWGSTAWVALHVRSHSDAFYPSSLFPWSVPIAGTQGVGVDFDPLALLFIEEAPRTKYHLSRLDQSLSRTQSLQRSRRFVRQQSGQAVAGRRRRGEREEGVCGRPLRRNLLQSGRA